MIMGLKTFNFSGGVRGKITSLTIIQQTTHLKLATCSGDAHSRLVSHDLSSHHGDRLALSGVDLPGHNAAARFVLGQVELAKPTTGSRAKITDVIGNFHERTSDHVECTVCFNQCVVGGQGFELAK